MGTMMSCFCVNDILIVSLANEPSGDSLLSILPSPSRSKPSSASAMASDETTIAREPMNGTMLAPMHSGLGANGSFLLPQPTAATTIVVRTRRRCMLPSDTIARQHRKPIPRRQQNCDSRVHPAGGDRHRRRAPRVRAVDGESLHQ